MVLGRICDAFLKTPLPEAKVSLLTPDSTVLRDSLPISTKRDDYGKAKETTFFLQLEKKTSQYFLRATCKGYGECWMPLSVDSNENRILFLDEALELRRERALGEAVVTATKLKMYYRGDTIVYDADAFKLPDGSMLDNLIRQLPGVTMNDAGKIFVNGRKIEELLLGSRSFFGGNKKVLLENLPYYTVQNIKVYEQETELSRAMGSDMPDKRFVMDVNLKDEYKQGYIGNAEAAYGTNGRYLGRSFLLGFTDKWRFTLLANGNNVNEKRHIGESVYWRPESAPRSLLTTHSMAGEIDYQSDNKNLKDNLIVEYTSSKDEAGTRRRGELFLNGSRPVSISSSTAVGKEKKWAVRNTLNLIKPQAFYGDFKTAFEYKTYSGNAFSLSEEFNDSLTTRLTSNGFNDGHSYLFDVYARTYYRWGKKKAIDISYVLKHQYDKNETARKYRTEQFFPGATRNTRNTTDYSNRNTSGRIHLLYSKQTNALRFQVDAQAALSQEHTHDFLYHPDTLLLPSELEALTAITDAHNSYTSAFKTANSNVRLTLAGLQPINTPAGTEKTDSWCLAIDGIVPYQRLKYQRGLIDTLVRQSPLMLWPMLQYNFYPKKRLEELLTLSVRYFNEPPSLLNRINFTDDATPLVVRLGNPALKGTATTQAAINYADIRSKHKGQQYHVGAKFNYYHRAVAQSVTYNPDGGIYTIKPTNVQGAYDFSCNFDFTRPLDKNQILTWQTNADARFSHSVDQALLAGETESRPNAVNTLTLHDAVWIQYDKNALSIRLTGDFRWRHSEGHMYDFSTLDAFDYQYGLTARYTIPGIKTTLKVDANMYSRRGYGSTALNADDFVLNASLNQSLLKGKLIVNVEAFDLFRQLSSTQYEVNAQGRTETWLRTLPGYIMLHLIYHFNKNPKQRPR